MNVSGAAAPLPAGAAGLAPVTAPTPAAAAEAAAPRAPVLTAFLVEDNPVIRDNLRAALQEMVPLEVVGTAQDEAGALAWLSDRTRGCDVVIIDLFIEGGSGMAVLSSIKTQDLPMRTVVLSNYSNGDMERRCLEIGADRVFDKSSQIDDLIEYCASLTPSVVPAAGAVAPAPAALAAA